MQNGGGTSSTGLAAFQAWQAAEPGHRMHRRRAAAKAVPPSLRTASPRSTPRRRMTRSNHRDCRCTRRRMAQRWCGQRMSVASRRPAGQTSHAGKRHSRVSPIAPPIDAVECASKRTNGRFATVGISAFAFALLKADTALDERAESEDSAIKDSHSGLLFAEGCCFCSPMI